MLSFLNKKNTFIIVLTILFFSLATAAQAQREIDSESNPPFKDRLYYGGNFAMQFGAITFIDVSPLVGVMITN